MISFTGRGMIVSGFFLCTIVTDSYPYEDTRLLLVALVLALALALALALILAIALAVVGVGGAS
jgi:hypothetical protein